MVNFSEEVAFCVKHSWVSISTIIAIMNLIMIMMLIIMTMIIIVIHPPWLVMKEDSRIAV